MNTCPHCGAKMNSRTGTWNYQESGLDQVELVGVTVLECPEGHHKAVRIPAVAELHQLLAFLVAVKPQRLVPQELRFLRTYLGYSRQDFAARIKQSPETWAAWESGATPIPLETELQLRIKALADKRIEAYPEGSEAAEAAGSRPAEALRRKIVRRNNHWSDPSAPAPAVPAWA